MTLTLYEVLDVSHHISGMQLGGSGRKVKSAGTYRAGGVGGATPPVFFKLSVKFENGR
jgi:hypothetical protein